ncbi:MAG: DUF262 domain-containing protein [Selenomonadaceae bacterium]|nr:DUF262 domain-containing protein [Selenomonadaceae bacterium]
MSDLNISKKNIYEIFSKRGVSFLIPDYQRPYSWGRDECETLWEDLYNFAFPEDKDFEEEDGEYFLGTIVTCKDYKENEVIDGQQRLITLLLLLRAFYEKFGDSNKKIFDKIAECIWHMDKDDNPDKTRAKIKSEVATEDDKRDLNLILESGEADKKSTSRYSQNYIYFQTKIDEFKNESPDNFSYLPKRIMQNCIMLPIETNSQSTAFRIFTTLNDRGMPLSDSDIFKSQFYKFFRNKGNPEKNTFVARWKELETICNDNFHPRKGTPTDDLFFRYMYYLLAKSGAKSDTIIGLRPYYEKNNYAVLKSEKTFEDLMILANFWNDIALRNEDRFSARILKRLYVLSYSPHGMWTYIVSMYFMGNRDADNKLDDEKFYNFLNKITAMFFLHSIAPGSNHVRRPFFVEFQNIISGNELSFENYIPTKENFIRQFLNTKFSQNKAITRAMLAWWTFQDEDQELPPNDTRLEIEHIYAKRRAEVEPLNDEESVELLGNKTLLEKRINIRASDYSFELKRKYYLGKIGKKNEQPTFNQELLKLAEKESFTENDILKRNEKIFEAFIKYLADNNLLK